MANLFQTTANQGFNSFQDPLNPFNTNPGNWGIDPAYLTPSYAAPYRPQYEGPVGAQTPTNNVGFWNSAANLFTPFGQTHYHGNSVSQDDPYFSSVTNRVADAGMWTAQRVVAPAIAFYAGMKASEFAVKSNSAAYTATMRTARELGGMAPTMAAMKSAKMGLGARIGANIGHGLAGGVVGGLNGAGLGVGARAASGIVGGAGLLGAGVGAAAMPFFFGQMAMDTLDATVFDPYAASRKTERSLRGNFTNVMASVNDNGNAVSGFGMSREFAAKAANRLTNSSIGDMMLDTGGMGELTDFAARSGMLDSTQLEQIEAKMKKIAKQVKVMMRVANEPDFRKAMEMLAELKIAGAGDHISGKVLQRIGGSSAIAGISSQQMMNTVGAQGQFLYQTNGLAPYLGQVQAANTYGAFSSAYRMGLIGDSTLAKFGGREGITQLAMTAQVNATQTPYNQIMMMNRYLHGGQEGSVVGNLGKMGQAASADPLALAGAMKMYGHDAASRQLMEDGSASILDQISQIAQDIPGMKNKDGRIDVEKAMLLMTNQMGLSEDESKAALKEMYLSSKPELMAQNRAARRGDTLTDVMKAMDQEGLGFGSFTPVMYGTRKAWKGLKQGVSDVTNAPLAFVGKMGDKLQDWHYRAQYGDLVGGSNPGSYEEFADLEEKASVYQLGEGSGKKTESWFSDGAVDFRSSTSGSIGELNRLARKGDASAAIAVDSTKSEEERRNAVITLAKQGKLSKEAMDDKKAAELADSAVGMTSMKFSNNELEETKYELSSPFSMAPQAAYAQVAGDLLTDGIGDIGTNLVNWAKDKVNGTNTPSVDTFSTTDTSRVFTRINELVGQDKLAAIVTNPNLTEQERRDALDTLNVQGKLGERLDSSQFNQLFSQISKADTSKVKKSGKVTKLSKVEAGLKDTLGVETTALSGLEAVEAARKMVAGEVDWSGNDKSVAKLREMYGEDLSKTELLSRATEITTKSALNDVAHLTSVFADGSSADKILAEAEKGNKAALGGKAGELAKEIKAIKGRTDLTEEQKKREIESRTLFERLSAANVPLNGPDSKTLPSSVTADTVLSITDKYRETAAQTLQNNKLAYQDKINFDTPYSKLAATEFDKAINSFGTFVGQLDGVAAKFKEAAEKISGEEVDSGTGLFSGVSSWFGGNSKGSKTGE